MRHVPMHQFQLRKVLDERPVRREQPEVRARVAHELLEGIPVDFAQALEGVVGSSAVRRCNEVVEDDLRVRVVYVADMLQSAGLGPYGMEEPLRVPAISDQVKGRGGRTRRETEAVRDVEST